MRPRADHHSAPLARRGIDLSAARLAEFAYVRDRATPLLLSVFCSAQVRPCLLPHRRVCFRARSYREYDFYTQGVEYPSSAHLLSRVPRSQKSRRLTLSVSHQRVYLRALDISAVLAIRSLASIVVEETFRLLKSLRGIKSRHCSEDNSC